MEDDLTPLRRSPLWQAVFKLDWADQQFHGATACLKEYLESGKCGVREEIKPGSHKFVAYAGRLPKEYPLLIGTGIHSLRSALDTAVSTLVQGVSRKEARTNFPCHQYEDNLRAEFMPGKTTCGGCKHERATKPRQADIIKHLPELEDLIFDVFKPWESGNYPLWALNKIDNIQKHRMLLLAWATASASFDYTTPEGVYASGNRWIMHPGTKAVIAESRKRVVHSRKPQMEFTPVFPSGVPFGGEPLLDVLSKLYKTTSGVLTRLYVEFKDHPAMATF